ncbi:hypothetical protein MSM1_20105 [Mycobacterium sp. SM1]|uniref:hypothetical protein n=1 Tax=Mycobacterium sp. SM1 TaxID=2816243 RepID=UPI001BCBE516|nr:hypothetical protein [Mycobacterium sp. SM1]MBS4730526.1 hypothetical protein [Mycobacterium sp. SM1]
MGVDAAEHWLAWLARYGDDYATDEERRAAYRDFKANLAALGEVFDHNAEPTQQRHYVIPYYAMTLLRASAMTQYRALTHPRCARRGVRCLI